MVLVLKVLHVVFLEEFHVQDGIARLPHFMKTTFLVVLVSALGVSRAGAGSF